MKCCLAVAAFASIAAATPAIGQQVQQQAKSIAFPTFTAQETGANSWLAGTWEATYGPNGKYTLLHDAKPFVEANYDLAFDEIVFKNETTPAGAGCSGPGRYRWTVNPTNGNLTLGLLSDDCANRVAFLTRRAFSKKV